MRKFYVEYLIAEHGLEKDRECVIEAITPRSAVWETMSLPNIIDVVCVSDITSSNPDEHFGVELAEWV